MFMELVSGNEVLRDHKNEKAPACAEAFAVWTRLELATPCVTGRYSNQLNYQTVCLLARANIHVFFFPTNIIFKFFVFF